MSADRNTTLVGPVINDRAVFEAALEAAEVDNPGVELIVDEREGYFRISAPGRLRISRISLEEALGKPFQLWEIEPYLSSFGGRINNEGDEEIVFYVNGEVS